MKLGVHTSIAGGLYKAVLRGQKLGCQVIQLFSKSPNQWKDPPLVAEQIDLFRKTVINTGVEPAMIHNSYLINIGSPSTTQARRSVNAFLSELKRAESLGIPYVVAHPGAHMESGEKKGLDNIVRRINELFRRTRGYDVMVLLETTSGQGSILGWCFEHFRSILDGVREPERLGICLDTCHIFSAGYDIRKPAAYQATIDLFDHIIGLDRLRAIHLNDSKGPLGNRKDRHEHIGKGMIGREGFRNLMQDPRFRDIPMVLETPKGKGMAADRRNLKVLNDLARQKRCRLERPRTKNTPLKKKK